MDTKSIHIMFLKDKMSIKKNLTFIMRSLSGMSGETFNIAFKKLTAQLLFSPINNLNVLSYRALRTLASKGNVNIGGDENVESDFPKPHCCFRKHRRNIVGIRNDVSTGRIPNAPTLYALITTQIGSRYIL